MTTDQVHAAKAASLAVSKAPIRFSVVTISFNQAGFLRQSIDSVLSQINDGIQVEYIVCDPGSTDGSRQLIDSYGAQIAHRVYERDEGPADGLNLGFAKATGDIYCYINSDDYFLPNAFAEIAHYMTTHASIDVVIGHGVAVDQANSILRRIWSEPYTRRNVAYGAHVQVQPATFIRAAAYRSCGGFDAQDRCTWDSTLLDRLFVSGAKFAILNRWLGAFRLHPGTITSSGRLKEMMDRSFEQRFSLLMGRSWREYDQLVAITLRIVKHLRWPHRALERARRGPIFMRGER